MGYTVTQGPLDVRFYAQHIPEPNSGCWLWTGSLTKNGYGTIGTYNASNRLRVKLAHRVSWELHRGPIPAGSGYHGTCVCHTCDVRACVNPGHLFLGTHAENMADMAAKGRGAPPPRTVLRGEMSPAARLTANDVREIRAIAAAGLSQRVLGRRFGVSYVSIGAILRGTTWRSVR